MWNLKKRGFGLYFDFDLPFKKVRSILKRQSPTAQKNGWCAKKWLFAFVSTAVGLSTASCSQDAVVGEPQSRDDLVNAVTLDFGPLRLLSIRRFINPKGNPQKSTSHKSNNPFFSKKLSADTDTDAENVTEGAKTDSVVSYALSFGNSNEYGAPNFASAANQAPQFTLTGFSSPQQSYQGYESPNYQVTYSPSQAFLGSEKSCNIEIALQNYTTSVINFYQKILNTTNKDSNGSSKSSLSVSQDPKELAKTFAKVPSEYFCLLSDALSCFSTKLQSLDTNANDFTRQANEKLLTTLQECLRGIPNVLPKSEKISSDNN